MLPRVYMKALHFVCKNYDSDKVGNRFIAAQVAYWWLANNYGGQSSNEYAELCWLSRYYKPGSLECGTFCEDADIVYKNFMKIEQK